MIKTLEITCKGNCGRSPIAELVANNFIRDIGADREFQAISSGTQVDDIRNGNYNSGSIKRLIGLYCLLGEEQDCFSKFLNTDNEAERKAYGMEVMNYAIGREMEERAKLLREFGIQGNVKMTADQTVPRKDIFAIMSVARDVHKQVLDIYATSRIKPNAHVISVLSTGNPNAPDSYIAVDGNRNIWTDYKRVTEQMIKDVRKAVANLVS